MQKWISKELRLKQIAVSSVTSFKWFRFSFSFSALFIVRKYYGFYNAATSIQFSQPDTWNESTFFLFKREKELLWTMRMLSFFSNCSHSFQPESNFIRELDRCMKTARARKSPGFASFPQRAKLKIFSLPVTFDYSMEFITHSGNKVSWKLGECKNNDRQSSIRRNGSLSHQQRLM